MIDPTWVTVTEAATLTGTSPSTIWRTIRRHNLDTLKYTGQRDTHVRRTDIITATRRIT